MLRCLIALTSLLTAAAAAAPAWTWVDGNGQRHFSDRPVPGAQQIDLPESQTFSRSTPRAQEASAAEDGSADQSDSYRVFEIASPLYGETLWNIGGNLDMQLEISPGLQSGHRIDAFLDGQRVQIGARGPQLTVPEVYRGLHTLQAVIYDASGQEVARSSEVNVMVQQTSLLNQNNANRPAANAGNNSGKN